MLRPALLALLATALVAACDDGGEGGAAPDAAADASPHTASPDVDASIGDAEGDSAGPACEGRYVTEITGSVVDEAGGFLPGAKAQACVRRADDDMLFCLNPGDTDFIGNFGIGVPPQTRCIGELSMRVFVPGEHRSTAYCAVEVEGGGETLSLERSIALFPTTPATDLPEEGDEDAPRTVTFAGGLEVDVTPKPLTVGGGNYAALAARWVEADPADLCVPPEISGVQGGWAFSPEADVVDATFPVRFPDKLGLEDGTEVEVSFLGGIACTLPDGTLTREGEWVPFATTTVTGGQVVLEGDDGLPCLTWMTYRPVGP